MKEERQDSSGGRETTTRGRVFAGILLAGLLLILALRMTGSEVLRETINQRTARLKAVTDARLAGTAAPEPVVVAGPGAIAGESAIVFLLAAGAAAFAAWSGVGISGRRLAQFGVIGAVLGCAVVSMARAENRFAAAVGVADLGMGIIAGWATAVLLELLGDRGRKAVAAGLIAILSIWVAKGFMQKLIEFPELAAFVREHQAEVLKSQGIENDPVQSKLFLSRVASGEVNGYFGFSNVFAAGLIGLSAVGAAVLVVWVKGRGAPVEPAPKETPRVGAGRRGEQEIPVDVICFIGVSVVVLAGMVMLAWTGSMGGTMLGWIAAAVIAAGGFLWKRVVAWRRVLIAVGIAGVLTGALGVVGYGIAKDTLPSKSLMFRWHYWTGSVPIIKGHALWGVGLNNFGDYYLQFKRPNSPEDVKDPHNFFVRLASEVGLPAMVLTGTLAAWMLLGAMRRRAAQDAAEGGSAPLIIGGVLTAGCWAVGHLLFFETAVEYTVYISILMAALAAVVFAAGVVLLRMGRGVFPGAAYIAIAAALGAGAMWMYDQINMALVSGPVAMMFWMMLGLGDSDMRAESTALKPKAISAWAGAAFCGAAGLTVTFALWQPVVAGTHAWDAGPHEEAFVRQAQSGNWGEARTALSQAIARSPHSLELRMKEITLLRENFPGEPLAEKIREALTLDRANAGVPLQLAMVDTDLPAAERAAALKRALELNAQLPAEEYKRLTPEVIAQVKAKIAALGG